MRTQRRWLESVIKASETIKPELPWARGANRTAMIARRVAKLGEVAKLSA